MNDNDDQHGSKCHAMQVIGGTCVDCYALFFFYPYNKVTNARCSLSNRVLLSIKKTAVSPIAEWTKYIFNT